MEWIDLTTTPSWTDWLGLVGLALTAWAAIAAQRKSAAVQRSITATKVQIATAHLRQSLDEIDRLADALEQSIKDKDSGGARYILLAVFRATGRSANLIARAKVDDTSTSDTGETISEILNRLSVNASKAKGKIMLDETKLESATRIVVRDLREIERDLLRIHTEIGYGMDGNDVHND